jgi:hypothetical protein
MVRKLGTEEIIKLNLFFQKYKIMSNPIVLLAAIVLVILIIYWFSKDKKSSSVDNLLVATKPQIIKQSSEIDVPQVKLSQIASGETQATTNATEPEPKTAAFQEDLSTDDFSSAQEPAAFQARYPGHKPNFPKFVARKSMRTYHDIPNPKYY